MAERVAGLALGDRAEQRGDVGVALDVGLLREVQVAAVRLALAGERLLEVVVGLGSVEFGHAVCSFWVGGWLRWVVLAGVGRGGCARAAQRRPRNTISVPSTVKPWRGRRAAGRSATSTGTSRTRRTRRRRGGGGRRRWDRRGPTRCRGRAAGPRPSPRGRAPSGTRSSARSSASRPAPSSQSASTVGCSSLPWSAAEDALALRRDLQAPVPGSSSVSSSGDFTSGTLPDAPSQPLLTASECWSAERRCGARAPRAAPVADAARHADPRRLRPRRRAAPGSATSSSTCSWSAAASPAPACALDAAVARACAPRSSSATTSRRARRRSRRSSSTAASATSSSGEVRLVYEALAERQIAAAATRRTSCACCPFLAPGASPATALIDREARPGARQRDVDVRPHRRRCASASCTSASSKDEALAHMPTLPPTNVAAAYLYYDAQADDARLTLTDRRAPRRRPRRRGREPRRASPGSRKDADGRVTRRAVDGRRRRRSRSRATLRRERDRRVGRRRARARRGRAPATRSGRRRASTSRCRGRRCATTSRRSSRCPKDRRSVFVVPWGDFTYIGTTDTDYDGPLDDPQCTPDDVDVPAAARSTRRCTTDDHRGRRRSARGPGCARSSRAATQRAHRRPLAPPLGAARPTSGVVTVTGGKLTTYRRMAADTVDAVGRAMLGAPAAAVAARSTLRLRGADGLRDAAPTPTRRHEHLADRYGTRGARRARARSTPTRRSASRSCPGCPYLRAEAVYAVRHEMARTLDDVLSRRTRARLLGRDASAAAAADGRRADRAPSSAGTTAERDAAGRRRTARAVDARSATAAGLPETALDAVARRLTAARCQRAASTDAGRADAADRVRPATPARRRPARRDAARRGRRRRARAGSRDACADGHRRRAAAIGEASRDWWPLAMIWALDGQVAARAPRSSPGPTTADEVAAVLARLQRGARPGHRGRRAAAACAARACPCTAASCST